MHGLLHQSKALTRADHVCITAGILQILSSIPDAPKADLLLETPALFSRLMKERSVSEPFAEVSLLDACHFAPYKDQRLRKPVRIAGLRLHPDLPPPSPPPHTHTNWLWCVGGAGMGEGVYSQDAASQLVEWGGGEDEEEIMPADDIARLLNRNPHVSQPCAFKGRLLAHVVQVRQRI